MQIAYKIQLWKTELEREPAQGLRCQKEHILGVGVMAQWAKCLPYQHDDQSLHPQQLSERQALKYMSVCPQESGDKQTLEFIAHLIWQTL